MQNQRAGCVRMLLKERKTSVNLIIFKCAEQEENGETKQVERYLTYLLTYLLTAYKSLEGHSGILDFVISVLDYA